MKSKKKKLKKKLPSIKTLWRKAWELQSKYIRSKDANFQEKTECYTCYRLFQWKELDAGHYKHGSYDFDIRHIKPQCSYCNRYAHGRPDEFYVHLIKEYGQEIADELRTRAHWNGYKRADLMEIIKSYT